MSRCGRIRSRLTLFDRHHHGTSFLGSDRRRRGHWGIMINENRLGLSANPWAVVVPAIVIALLTVGTTYSPRVARVALASRQIRRRRRARAQGLEHDPGRVDRWAGWSRDARSCAPARRDLQVAPCGAPRRVWWSTNLVPCRGGRGLGLVGEPGRADDRALALLVSTQRVELVSGRVFVDGSDVLASSPRICVGSAARPLPFTFPRIRRRR